MSGRIVIRAIAGMIALYVLIAMFAAFARVPGHDMAHQADYEMGAPAAYDAELYELRTEDVVP